MSEGNGKVWAPEVKDLGEKIVALTSPRPSSWATTSKRCMASSLPLLPSPWRQALARVRPSQKARRATEFSVILESFDAAKKINVIKVVREINRPGPQGSQGPGRRSSKPVKENVSKDEAAKIKQKLEEGGAKAALK